LDVTAGFGGEWYGGGARKIVYVKNNTITANNPL